MGGSPDSAAGQRFLIPNTTQVPNVILDEWLAILTGAMVKVVLYVARRTYGFQRQSDHIAISQIVNGFVRRDGTRLDYGTGLSRSQALVAISDLEKAGVMIKHRNKATDGGDLPPEYSLNLNCNAQEVMPKLELLKVQRKGRKKIDKSNGQQGSPKKGLWEGENQIVGVQKPDPQNQVSQNPVVKNQELKIDRRAISEKSDKPWSVLNTEVDRVPDFRVCREADRLADQLVALVDVRRDLARRLAQLSIERREADMLVRVALRVADTEPSYPWPALLTAIINAREEEGGRR